MALEWYWWVVIGVSVVAVGATIYLVLDSSSEEESLQTKDEEMDELGWQVWDLSDAATRKAITKEGVAIDARGDLEYFSVSENLTTGYEWIIDPKGCSKQIIKVETSYDAPAQLEESEEPIMGAPGTKYITFTGVEPGKCTFRMAYARQWEFDWEDEATKANADQIIEIPVVVAAAKAIQA